MDKKIDNKTIIIALLVGIIIGMIGRLQGWF
jgi:uncharacterized membrane-anchored protein YhcB (DUF1043 family)